MDSFVPISEELCATLTERWHDQSVDLRTVRFSEPDGSVELQVLEEQQRIGSVPRVRQFGIFTIPLVWCMMKVQGANSCVINNCSDTIDEMIIERVVCHPGYLHIIGGANSIEISGATLKLALMTKKCATLIRKRIALGCTDISWTQRVRERKRGERKRG